MRTRVLQLWPVWMVIASFTAGCSAAPAPIDRSALVHRHNVVIETPDALSPLTVGNGNFAFTTDITGLQTFPGFHEKGMALGTQSQWGWHTQPNPENYTIADALEPYTVSGREIPYASGKASTGRGYSQAATWLRSNPHRIDLARIGFRFSDPNITIEDLRSTHQELDLWTGELRSDFKIDGEPVHVRTICHGDRDELAVRIQSPLLTDKRLAVAIEFSYGRADWAVSTDFDNPDRHTTAVTTDQQQARLSRTLDADRYYVELRWSKGARIESQSQHRYEISGADNDTLSFILGFSAQPSGHVSQTYQSVRLASADRWEHFWKSGGAIDFSQCTDPRAGELERRVVLSQYLTAVNCSGDYPPQETGLVRNSWYGKFHLEMHWWHAAHFALWGRENMLERSLPWYDTILPRARETAKMQGFRGARWPKMTDPAGRESPSEVGVFLIWQQPHPIYYAELCYRAHGDRATLERYRTIVFETAEFMSSYPIWDEQGQRYVLGPALIPAQESYGRYRQTTINPTFELAYWWWALETAQQWRLRLGLEREPRWDKVRTHLSRPTIRNGVYEAIETDPWTITRDHPSMVAALGVVPATPLIDPDTMQRTLDRILADWDWASTWGWDYPMLAMTAARLGQPEKAVDALFMDTPKNRYLANGHNYQSARLPLYLPGNGGLLSAVAMMAAG